MPEPTTRDEHVAEARKLARRVDDLYTDPRNSAGARSDYESDDAYYQAIRLENELHETTLVEMQTWAQLAMVHIKIAEVLGQQPAEGCAPVWVPTSKHRYVRNGGVWVLEFRSRLFDDDPDVGWWLTGLGIDQAELLGNVGLYAAQHCADRRIVQLAAEAQS